MDEYKGDLEVVTLEVDETLKKQLGFLGIMYQIFGVLSIISGVLFCITIIGAILGVPYLMFGLKLFKSGGSFSETARNVSGDSLKNALSELAKAVKIWLITVIAVIILYAVMIIIMIMVGVFAGSQGY